MTAQPTAGRPRLRELRTELGWTQQEMADRLANLAWMQRDKHVGVNADMIAKWERGVRGVSPRYRELLCRLFGVTPDQLGLKSTPVSIATGGVAPGEDESLVGMLDNAAHLRMTADALRRDPTPEERRRLLRNQTQVAVPAGRLAADDLGNSLSGRAYYTLALDAAREVGDDHLTALVHGYTAELAAADGMTTAALDHLTQATELTRSYPVIASWLATVEATIYSVQGSLARDRHGEVGRGYAGDGPS